MKLKLLCFSFLVLLSLNIFAEITYTFNPDPVVVGETAQLSISSTEGVAEIVSLPEIPNIRWMKNSQMKERHNINGKQTEITRYSFVADKAGKIQFPTLKLSCNGEEYKFDPKAIEVVSGILSDLDKYILVEPQFSARNKIYVGQSVQLEIDLLISSSINAQPVEYPQVQLDNVLFGNLNPKSKENERFLVRQDKIRRDEILYNKISFLASFRAMSPGKLKGTVSIPILISVPDKNRDPFGSNKFFSGSFFDDPFFKRDKQISKLLSVATPELEILPLPKEPENSNFIGLFGKWDCKITASPDKLLEGETLTIKAEISGYGSLETLKAPELNISGFTAYKPEIEKQQSPDLSGDKSKAVITYLLIPKKAGKNELALSFCTFNTIEDKYDICSMKKSVEIGKNGNLSAPLVIQPPAPQNYGNLVANDDKKRSETNSILYIKKNTAKIVLMPLWKNFLPYYICLIILGPLIFAASELLRKKKAANTEALIRKQKAMKNRGKILRELKARKGSDFVNYIDSDVVPFINDVSGFPPGTTSYELASKLSDRAFSDCLDKTNRSRYMPETDLPSEKELKSKLFKCLKKLHVFIIGSALLFCSLNLNASSASDFISEYNKGNFAKAQKICLENIDPSHPSPAWLYNLGNSYTQEGKLAQAIVSYERALLLDPRDQDALQNLNFVRRILFLPPMYQTRTPLELLVYLRDILRPDEWLLGGAIFFFLFFMVLAFRRKLSRYSFISSSIILVVLVMLSIGVYINQTRTLYSDKNAIVIVNNPVIHSLPASDSSEVKMTLALGDDVKIEDKLNDWTLISSKHNKAIGWVKNDCVEQIWPY